MDFPPMDSWGQELGLLRQEAKPDRVMPRRTSSHLVGFRTRQPETDSLARLFRPNSCWKYAREAIIN